MPTWRCSRAIRSWSPAGPAPASPRCSACLPASGRSARAACSCRGHALVPAAAAVHPARHAAPRHLLPAAGGGISIAPRSPAALTDVGLAQLVDGSIARRTGRCGCRAASSSGWRSPARCWRKPDWLFLDEATASLDPEAETELYRILQERLPERDAGLDRAPPVGCGVPRAAAGVAARGGQAGGAGVWRQPAGGGGLIYLLATGIRRRC